MKSNDTEALGVTWPFETRHLRRFGSAAIPYVVYAVRSAFLATATLLVHVIRHR